MRKSLVILTRNEIAGLTEIFARLPLEAVDEVFCVDYRSTDGTREFLERRGIRVFDQEKRGRGEAFRVASSVARGELLIFFSPDGNEDPRDIPKLAALVERGADLAVASRFLPGARNEEADKILRLRAWANRGFTLLANLFFGGRMTDSINGYRAMRKERFDSLGIDADGFTVEYQISIRSMKLGFDIREIPTIESDRIGNVSGARSIPTGLAMLRVLLREIALGGRFRHRAGEGRDSSPRG
jgi:glycosyltransferase involved in cell wall biosynthesis